jgi:hypothetical protein
MNDSETFARIHEVLAAEVLQPERWFYLSFFDKAFKGAVVIRAHGITTALIKTHALRINPGGEVLCRPLPDSLLPPESDRNRLLTEAEVEAIWPGL